MLKGDFVDVDAVILTKLDISLFRDLENSYYLLNYCALKLAMIMLGMANCGERMWSV